MNVFDSSILVAALVESEFHHAACKTLVTSGTFGVWSHSFVETFNTLNTGHFESFWREGDPAIAHP